MRLLLVMLVACSSSSSKPSAQPDARAYVLGKGVERDYRIAAKLYREQCADGCGDLAACHEYIELAVSSRGALASKGDANLVWRACDRGDRMACMFASLVGLRWMTLEERDALSARCDAGDIAACTQEVDTHVFTDSSTHAERIRSLELKVCGAKVLRSCIRVLEEEWTRCEYDDKSAGEQCVAARNRPALTAAWNTVSTACGEGDALACAVVPGREIPRSVRCKAGDYFICAQLAENGDQAAAAVACAGGMTELCVPEQPRDSLFTPGAKPPEVTSCPKK